ncbi:MAG TPA: orotidine-5'-phosphate decarboxylase [Xanthobacteraceae bacterium]|nr:orotidine-5'-phosphate decarboxylase [Xanthobacteraceae bacterium]
MNIPPLERLIVALDLADVAAAEKLVVKLDGAANFYKIGYELALAKDGLVFAEMLARSGKKVFLDLKLHDIGNTVTRAVERAAESGMTFLTVHAFPQTMRAAVKGRGPSKLKILAVTVLTSWDEDDLREAGYQMSVSDLVLKKAGQAKEIGIDGIVASAAEAAPIRKAVGAETLIITPGIRPAGSEAGDQKRIVTPKEAIKAGADYLVVGRPVTGAADPIAATQSIVAEIAAALK